MVTILFSNFTVHGKMIIMTSKKRKLAYIRKKNILRQGKSYERFQFKISKEISGDEDVIEQLAIGFSNQLKRYWRLNFTLFDTKRVLVDNDFCTETETCVMRFKVAKI